MQGKSRYYTTTIDPAALGRLPGFHIGAYVAILSKTASRNSDINATFEKTGNPVGCCSINCSKVYSMVL